MLYSETTATKKILALQTRIRAVQGGSSAGKTIGILLALIGHAQTAGNTKLKDAPKDPVLISIVSESLPHLKKGAIRDFLNIMESHKLFQENEWNRTDFIYTFPTKSKIEFFGVEQSEKVRGPRRDVLFINEAINIDFETFEQLTIRTNSYIFLDWNPSSEFWFEIEVKPNRNDVEHIILTYKDNEILPPAIVNDLEQKKYRKNWWKVFGEGQLADIEGRIYSNWKVIPEVPHEARLERYGLDFGYTCLKGDTIVETSNGGKRIDEIKEGDFVLTRNGLKKVICSLNNGYTEVYRLDFGLDKHIIVTGDHRVFTINGWKQVCELADSETICVLKQGLTEGCIKDIQGENTETTSILRKRQGASASREFYTEMSTRKPLAKSLMDFVSTILIKIPLIIVQTILLLFPIANIRKYIFPINSEVYPKKKCKKSVQEFGTQEIIGKREERKRWKQRKEELENVLSAVKISLQQMFTRNTAEVFVEKEIIQEPAQRSISARTAEESLLPHLISQEIHVLQNVRINLQLLKEKVEVYDLTIEDEHEFFANGVLVHNCDPTAIVAVYYFNGGYILDELCYTTGMLNRDIANFLKSHPRRLIVADSSEPKSIEEIKRYDLSIIGAKKKALTGGTGKFKSYLRWSIGVVQQQQISVTSRSVNLLKEYRNYWWLADRDGKVITPEEPETGNDHALDAVRYALVSIVPLKDLEENALITPFRFKEKQKVTWR